MAEKSGKRKLDQTSKVHNKKTIQNKQNVERELTDPELSQVVGGIKIVKPRIY